MIYLPFKSYELNIHMAEELKKSFRMPKALFGEFDDDSTNMMPNREKYCEYFRSFVPDTLCCDYIDEIFALKELFHHITAKDYEEVYPEGEYKFEENIDISEIYSTVLFHNSSYYKNRCWQYIFYYHYQDPVNRLHEIYLNESKTGIKEIDISYYGGKKYTIKFAPGAQLKRSTYKNLGMGSYYYRSLPIDIGITTLNNEKYTYSTSSIYDLRNMANTILQDSKALYYLVKFYSYCIGDEYVHRLTSFK